MAELSEQEQVIEQAAQVVMSGRCALITAEDHERLSDWLGDLAMYLIEFGSELARMDALHAHEPAAMLESLVMALGVSRDELVASLRIRGETGNPVLLLVDNAECLSAASLRNLGKLLNGTQGGLGVVLCGDHSLAELLPEAQISPSLALSVDDVAVDEDADTASDGRLPLPWPHLVAVLGLLLLVWLLWPRDSTDSPAREGVSQPLALPDRPAAEPVTAEPVATPPPADDPPPETPPAQDALLPELEPVPEEQPEPAPAPAVKAPQPAPQPSSPTLSSPELSGMAAELGYRQEDWLLALPPGDWLLQLALATTENAARSTLDQLGRDRGGYYRGERDGRTVFLVVAGPWPSREAASAARAQLPTALRERGPFPRKVGEVQSEVR